jgi:hypothetical protein
LHNLRNYYLELNLTTNTDQLDVSAYIKNDEWDLKSKQNDLLTVHVFFSALGFTAMNSVKQYDCCPQIYQDIKLFIKISRHSRYYFTNIIGTKNTVLTVFLTYEYIFSLLFDSTFIPHYLYDIIWIYFTTWT